MRSVEIRHLGIVECQIRHAHDDFSKWKEGQYGVFVDNRLVKKLSYPTGGYAIYGGYKSKEKAKEAAEEYLEEQKRNLENAKK